MADGLRVDHVDGLADPKAYLERLREKAGPGCYITVEKILGKGERLPPDWPVSGTTGYEFIASLSDVLVNDENIAVLSELYDSVIGKPVDMRNELRAAKLMMVEKNFEGEYTTLWKLANSIAGTGGAMYDENDIRTALRELLIAFRCTALTAPNRVCPQKTPRFCTRFCARSAPRPLPFSLKSLRFWRVFFVEKPLLRRHRRPVYSVPAFSN